MLNDLRKHRKYNIFFERTILIVVFTLIAIMFTMFIVSTNDLENQFVYFKIAYVICAITLLLFVLILIEHPYALKADMMKICSEKLDQIRREDYIDHTNIVISKRKLDAFEKNYFTVIIFNSKRITFLNYELGRYTQKFLNEYTLNINDLTGKYVKTRQGYIIKIKNYSLDLKVNYRKGFHFIHQFERNEKVYENFERFIIPKLTIFNRR